MSIRFKGWKNEYNVAFGNQIVIRFLIFLAEFICRFDIERCDVIGDDCLCGVSGGGDFKWSFNCGDLGDNSGLSLRI